MQKIGIINILLGFITIVVSSCMGFFLVADAEKAFLVDTQILSSWSYTLFKSAHGHFNLFGMLHILMGLSFPYSKLPYRWLILQSLGLLMGTLTMGGLVLIRARIPPPQSLDLLGILIGCFLVCSLLSLMTHCYGLGLKVFR